MPIKVPDGLPANTVLAAEQVFVMTEERAIHQDIRPLNLLMLNLMPNKINTEIQFLRMLSNSPLQVNVKFLRVDKHFSKNTPQAHLDTFYCDFNDIRENYFDGMIVTGAPLDKISFDDVTYWDKLVEIIKWSAAHVTSTYFSCWGVAAGLKIFYDVEMVSRNEKLSGVYMCQTAQSFDTIIRGFDERFLAPFSRYIDFAPTMFTQYTDLQILAEGPACGVYLAVSPDKKQVYVTGHPEYDATTLSDEYRRDIVAGKNPRMPVNYFPFNDPALRPSCSWRSHASMLYGNWLNYYVYQVTPFEFKH